MKAAKYQRLKRQVELAEATKDPALVKTLIESLRPKAADGNRYKILLDRVLRITVDKQKQPKRLDNPAPWQRSTSAGVKPVKMGGFRAQKVGLGLNRGPRFEGGQQVSGGLPGTKR